MRASPRGICKASERDDVGACGQLLQVGVGKRLAVVNPGTELFVTFGNHSCYPTNAEGHTLHGSATRRFLELARDLGRQ